MQWNRDGRSVPALLLAVACSAGACSGGPTGESLAGNGGRLVLAFSKVAGAPGVAGSVAAAAGNVSLSQIESITVTVTALEALYQSSDADEAEWVTRTLDGPIVLDLLALPVDPDDAVTATVDALDVGTYFNLRLHVSEATIVFAEDIRAGGGPVATTYAAGDPHPIRIAGEPGGRLLLPTTRFEILDGGATEVDIMFDEGTSVRSVVATPNFLLMTPVLIAASDRPDD